ncbi:gfo/Idh/MocA family oxidoreductase [Aquimarina sp. AD10]|uniref:Gfo/Idh/MocA family protein n=1 Tax=Aquimarina sp. AD10 TaxID=1714849 RepID=UPI000E4F14B4|nr:Gfo/Idh/MocA family oxidoreductase [Aquimarina sp. AD10]AXT59009.1 gfo/Idh/MocA family oxidoreductase [Aquimarina sp. AD10]RKM95104.1 gfo/Idh/MocA family oxidoreductase [Aquimarina sp. AD10]
MKKISRRTFNSNFIKGMGGIIMASHIPMACGMSTYSNSKKKLGIALVGLGTYSTHELAPSLLETEYCELTAIVTGTPEKEKLWAAKYDIPKENIYNYENFDTIATNDAVDIIYVVLPNAMHADFCIRAAKAGKHVICEKPMAVSVEECESIIDACAKANVKLSVGYRLHSEPYTQEVKRIVKEKTFGKVNYISAEAAYLSRGNWDQWRFNKKLSGGGALMNMGVYAIQGLIYGTGELPISVTAQEFSTMPENFKDTDETITAQFEFPSGTIGNLFTSHNAKADRLYASCEKGWYELDTAYTYGPLHGRTSEGTEIKFPHKRQQALQMDDFAKHILHDTPNKVPGSMGLRDIKIVKSIYKSIEEGGKKIAIRL